MLTAFLKRKIAAVGREYDYDVSYMHELASVDARAFRRFVFAMPFFSQPAKAPERAFWAAKLRSTMHADCGSCLRLVITMARQSGMETTLIRDILTGNSTDADAALGADYADAVVNNSPDLAEVISKIRKMYGKRGLASMAAAVCSGQFFPVFKRGFGHGNACEPILRQLELTA